MKKYKVVALSVGGKGKNIYKSGQEVTEKHFPDGTVPELIAKGFIKPLDSTSPEAKNFNKEAEEEAARIAKEVEDAKDKKAKKAAADEKKRTGEAMSTGSEDETEGEDKLSPEEKREKLYDECMTAGKKALKGKKYEEAAGYFETALEAKPEDAEATGCLDQARKAGKK